MDLQKISVIAGLLVVLAGTFSGAFSLDGRYAKSVELQQTNKRLDIKIQEDRAVRIQERIWRLEDRYSTLDKASPADKEEWRKLEAEKKSIDSNIQELIHDNGR